MFTFWLLCFFLTLIAIVVIIKTLLKKHDQQEQAYDTIYQQQLAELQTDIENGLINETEADAVKKELELSILNQDQTNHQQTIDNAMQNNYRTPRVTLTICLVLLPVFAVSLYQELGNPQSIEQTALLEEFGDAKTPEEKTEAIEKMLSVMEERLMDNPDDFDGWLMLTNSYTALERHSDALRAVENLYRLKGDDPSVMLRYADILSMANNGIFKGKPADLIEKAMELDPDNTHGLWLSGLAAIQLGELETAISTWGHLLTLLEEDAESRKQIEHYIKLAKAQLVDGNTPDTQESISNITIPLNVSLADNLLNDANAADTVFIYATATEGPAVPLAIVRKQVSDLPTQVILDDSISMIPGKKLSSYEQVKLIARVSRNGQAKPESGDLQGTIDTVQTNVNQPLDLIIDKTIP